MYPILKNDNHTKGKKKTRIACYFDIFYLGIILVPGTYYEVKLPVEPYDTWTVEKILAYLEWASYDEKVIGWNPLYVLLFFYLLIYFEK